MKKTILIIIAIMLMSYFIFSCGGSTSPSKPKEIKSDTSQRLAIYIDHTDSLRTGQIFRVIMDSFKSVQLDSITYKKMWAKDTQYIYNFYGKGIDSLGKIIIDSSTKSPKMFPYFGKVPASRVLADSGVDIDSLVTTYYNEKIARDSIAEAENRKIFKNPPPKSQLP